MSRKLDIVTTRAMYSIYQQGKSCSQVALAFNVSRQSVYERFSRQGFKLRDSSRSLALPFIEFEGKRYAPEKDGYFRKTTGDRESLHWAIWRKEYGDIPQGHVVCFVDGDRMNVTIDNLACVRKGEDRRFGRFMQLRLKPCLACGQVMGRRMGWDSHHEGPAAYAKRKTCDPRCSADWKRGKSRGSRMP